MAACQMPALRLYWYRGDSTLNRRVLFSLFASFDVLVRGVALAKNQHHHNGHDLLGSKLHQNGKHEIGKAGNTTVVAEVSNKQVMNISAAGLPVRKVKSNKKMVDVAPGATKVAFNGEFQLAEIAEAYYGYCVDAGLDEYCYWYPAADAIVTDTWVETSFRLGHTDGVHLNGRGEHAPYPVGVTRNRRVLCQR